MPTVFTEGPYRFYFYAGDQNEPPHIHVMRDGKAAKFWLDSISFSKTSGLGAKDLRKAQWIIEANAEYLRSRWDVFFREEFSGD